jgi:hypothetical protein
VVTPRAGAPRGGHEVCAQGSRGASHERFLAPAEPPLIADVRRQSVLNLVDIYRRERTTPSVTELALAVYDGRAAGHPAAGAP